MSEGIEASGDEADPSAMHEPIKGLEGSHPYMTGHVCEVWEGMSNRDVGSIKLWYMDLMPKLGLHIVALSGETKQAA